MPVHLMSRGTHEGSELLRTQQETHPTVTLGENLISVLKRFSHRHPHPSDDLIRHLIVEQIGHAVHEDPAWFPPPERKVKYVGVHGDTKSRARGTWVTVTLILRCAHSFETLRHCQGVTVCAPVTHPIATSRRIPGLIGPFYTSTSTHSYLRVWL